MNWPLLLLSTSGEVLTLDHFRDEVERTIFHSGTIFLYNEAYPLSADDTIETLTLESMRTLLSTQRDWSILLPQ